MTRVADLRQDLEVAAEEAARLRSFLRAIEERACMREGEGGREREKLAAIRSLVADAFDLTAPVPDLRDVWRIDLADARPVESKEAA